MTGKREGGACPVLVEDPGTAGDTGEGVEVTQEHSKKIISGLLGREDLFPHVQSAGKRHSAYDLRRNLP